MSNDEARESRQLTLGLVAKGRSHIPVAKLDELVDALQEILFLAAMAVVEEESRKEASHED
jgi:hypothetical protein